MMGLALMLTVVGAPPAAAVTLPANFTQSTYGTALGPVTAMAFAPDGRLFVAAQDGTVRIVKSTGTVATPFVKLAVDHQGERGLTGIAIDPNFAANGYVYLYYATATAPIHNTVSRLVADGDVARSVNGVPVQTTIFDLEASSTTANIHNGGAMDFGTDGKLYVAVGDNARGANGQSMTTTFGKLLRINRDGTIPTDNPFYATATGSARAIYSLGLRNPFTFGIHPGTGRTFINDVGASTWEEINEAKRGSNHGWSLTEGPTTDPRFASPIYAYHHTTGTVTGCAITGGTFYNPESARYPAEYLGDYFFADFCGHWIKRFDPATGTVTNFAGSTAIHPVDLKVGPDGNLYYLSRGTSSVFRVNYTGSLAPTIDTHPADQTVSAGDPVTFSVEATGAGLSYQWQRDDVDIAGATSQTLRLAAVEAADDGALYRVVVTNSSGSVTSNAARLTVGSNRAPTGQITEPAAAATYAGGQTITYRGTGADPEDGELPASAFTWRVDLHHDAHVHPAVPASSGSRSGSFVVPDEAHTDSNVFYRIHLTVTDSGGRQHATFTDLQPRTSRIELATVPAGLQLSLDDQPRTTPYAVTSVVGVKRSIEAISPQTLDGKTYEFVSWSDGGTAARTVTTAATDTTYTANFELSTAPAPAPIASFSASATSGTAPLTVNFTDTSTGSPTSWAWDFGNGTTSTTQNPSATFSAAGTYTVSLRATNAAGTSTAATKTITVTNPGGTTRTVTLNPTHDTQVKQASPGTNYANGGLWADTEDIAGNTSSRVHDYLKFDVPALATGETITGARLSLNVTNSTGNGPGIYRTATTWTEATTTWNTGRPARTGTAAVGNYAGMPVARVSTPVAGITTAGEVSFELSPESTDGVGLSSSEATSTSRPQLILTISS